MKTRHTNNTRYVCRYILPALMVSLVSGCASSNPFSPKAPNNLYGCDQARQIIISTADISDTALIQYEGRTITLKRINNAYSDAFTNNIFTLYMDDDLAALEREGAPILSNCRPL